MNEEYSTYHELMCACYIDIASANPAQNEEEYRRDLETIKSRFATEGLGFLTKTLPSLVKAVDLALASGTVLQVQSFARKRGSKLPRFLGWLLGRVFTSEGLERSDADPSALRCIRQLLLFYKLELPMCDNDAQRVIDEFVVTDEVIGIQPHLVEPAHVHEVRTAAKLISRVLASADPREIIPGHGPGSVADGEREDGKAYFKSTTKEMEEIYPLDKFFYYSPNHYSDRLDKNGLYVHDRRGSARPWKVLETRTAKVVLVPKDSRGPRLISMEPLENQWIQQGQCALLVTTIESHWLTKGHVNFENQSINRYLAFRSSMSTLEPSEKSSRLQSYEIALKRAVSKREWLDTLGPDASPVSDDLVTLDMKEASDRVSLRLLYGLFPGNWIEALMASRSAQTRLPNGSVIPLNKFAPMGSAVCFPVEALVFWALAVSSIMSRHPNLSLAKARQRVWVYGDDIVCHREDYPAIKQSLERVGLLLNSNKCCVQGSFRESCGMDAYKGTNVTPLRIKKRMPISSRDGQSLVAWVEYSNSAYSRGLTNLASTLERVIKRHIRLPYSNTGASGAVFVRDFDNVRDLNKSNNIKVRFNPNLQRYEARGLLLRPITIKAKQSYETILQKIVPRLRTPHSDRPTQERSNFVNNEVETSRRLKSDQYSLPRRVSSMRGWTQIFM